MTIMIYIIFIIMLFFAFASYIISRYRTCPSDKVLVVYGQTGLSRASKCTHGGGMFVLPIIQDYQYIDLTPIGINININDIYLKNNLKINEMSLRLIFGISTEEDIMENASVYLLEKSTQEIEELAKNIAVGQIRFAISKIEKIEEIKDKDNLMENIATEIEKILNKIGLKLINININSIIDEGGKRLI